MKKLVVCFSLFLLICGFLFAETKWYKTNSVDDFGDPTGHFSVYTENLSGTYKSRSTTNGKLTYIIEVNDSGYLLIHLFEDGKSKDVTTTSDGEFSVNTNERFEIQIKFGNGEVGTYNGRLNKNADYKYDLIYVSNHDFRYDLVNEDVLKIVVSASNGSYSLGSIDTSVITGKVFFDSTLYDEGLKLMGQGQYQDAINKFNELKTKDKESYDFYKVDEIKSEAKKQLGLYDIGDTGPSGGYIFFDKGDYSDGWRYLEAAPADLRVVYGVPTVDASKNGYSAADTGYAFGNYRTSDSGSNLYVNGTTTYSASNCTGEAVGTGRSNTEKLVAKMGASTYSSGFGSTKTGNYAARLCDVLKYSVNGVTYDDWFLPSMRELRLMYDNLQKAGLGSFAADEYWSSSEHSFFSSYAVEIDLYNGMSDYRGRGNNYRVRPIRAF